MKSLSGGQLHVEQEGAGPSGARGSSNFPDFTNERISNPGRTTPDDEDFALRTAHRLPHSLFSGPEVACVDLLKRGNFQLAPIDGALEVLAMGFCNHVHRARTTAPPPHDFVVVKEFSGIASARRTGYALASDKLAGSKGLAPAILYDSLEGSIHVNIAGRTLTERDIAGASGVKAEYEGIKGQCGAQAGLSFTNEASLALHGHPVVDCELTPASLCCMDQSTREGGGELCLVSLSFGFF